MFEDEEFDLDVLDSPSKSDEKDRGKVGQKSIYPVGQITHDRPKVPETSTQKSMFSIDDTFESDAELLELSIAAENQLSDSHERLDKVVNKESDKKAGVISPSQSGFLFKVPGTVSSSPVVPKDFLRKAGASSTPVKNWELNDTGKEKSNQEQRKELFVTNERIGTTGTGISTRKNQAPIPTTNSRKRRFPGPAGLLPRLTSGNFTSVDNDNDDSGVDKPGEDRASIAYSQSQESVCSSDEWRTALRDLGMVWGREEGGLVNRYNVGFIKKKSLPGTSKKMPFFIARVKSLDTSSLDPVCVLADPLGEVSGSIHRDVIEQFGADVHVGSVLVLRNVVVLTTVKNHYVNITANNLVSIYKPEKVAHIYKVNQSDMEKAALELEEARQEQLKRFTAENETSLDLSMINQGDQNRHNVNESRPTFIQDRPSFNLNKPLINKTYNQPKEPIIQTWTNQTGQNMKINGPAVNQTRPIANQTGSKICPITPNLNQMRPSVYQQRPTTSNHPNYGTPTQPVFKLPQKHNSNENTPIFTKQQSEKNQQKSLPGDFCTPQFRTPADPPTGGSTSKFVFRSKTVLGNSTCLSNSTPRPGNVNTLGRREGGINQDPNYSGATRQQFQFQTGTTQPNPSQNRVPLQSQNLIDSMMEGIDSESLFGDF